MPRNLDLTALRSFVTVAESGGVTRAAGLLNLTQSAVSMQLKRLEESLGQPLLDRSGRGIAVTPQGEQLLGYGRRLLALNDEVWGLMRDEQFEGEITLGVPHDIVYPYIPGVLQRIAAEYPRVRVKLVSSYTRNLKEQFADGLLDVILTTEHGLDTGGETLLSQKLLWVGAPGGSAWKSRPIPLAFEDHCIFRGPVQKALDDADIPWQMAVTSESTRTIDATVSADLAIHANLLGNSVPYMEVIDHGGGLPELPQFNINMYIALQPGHVLAPQIAGFIRESYGHVLARAAE
jgi:DNA-binding transcriptional LysR family regulator